MSIQRRNFSEGVFIILHHWPALRLARDEGWSGPQTEEKFSWLVDEIIQLFFNGRSISWDDLELILEDVIEAEFNIELEDNSARTVARHIVSLFEQCQQSNYEELDNLRKHYDSKHVEQKICADPSTISSTDDDDDDDDDKPQQNHDQMTSEVVPMEGLESSSDKAISDPDGWHVVQTKKKASKK